MDGDGFGYSAGRPDLVIDTLLSAFEMSSWKLGYSSHRLRCRGHAVRWRGWWPVNGGPCTVGDFGSSANIQGIPLLVRWSFHNRGLEFFPEVPQEVEKAE